MAQQVAVSADQLFKPKAGSPQPPPPGGVSADTLFGGAKPAVQQPPAAPVVAQPPQQPKPVVPQQQPPTSGMSPVQKAMPFTSGLAEQSGLDPAKIASYNKFGTQAGEVTKQLMRGMSDWMGKTAKDPFHIVDPFESLARGVEFHIAGHDPFGVGKQETPIDEIVRSLKSGDTEQLKHASGRFVGALTGIAGGLEAKGAPGKLSDLSKVIGTDVPKAANKPKLVAAANDVLQETAKTKTTELAGAIKQTRQRIGQDVQVIANADRVFQQARGTPAGTQAGLTADLANTVAGIKAGSTPLTQTKQVFKSLQKYGQNLTWEDMKDFRSVVDKARQSATGKDLAVLGKMYSDLTTQLGARAKLVGKEAEFTRYSDTTKALTEHSKGIVNDLSKAKTGLDFYNIISKGTNQPRLNAFASTVGLPRDFFSEVAKSHEPLAAVAKSGDSATNAIAGRLQALAKHPYAVGATGAATMLSPLPAKYIVSLWTMGKAGELMDRLDAATALRKLQDAKQGMSGIPQGNPTPFGPGASQGGPPSPSGPVPPSPTSPAAPVAANSISARIQAMLEPTWAKKISASVKASADALEKSGNAKLAQAMKDKGLVFPENAPRGTGPEFGTLPGETLPGPEKPSPLDKAPFHVAEDGRKIAGAQFMPLSVEDAAKHFTVDGVNHAPEVGLDTEQGVKNYQEKLINKFVEKPVQPLVRKLLAEGKRPMESNAYGPGEKGVWYEDPKTGERKFEKYVDKRGEAPAQEIKPIVKTEKATTTNQPKAFEKFGVTVDTSSWKTPEDVVKGKAEARANLEQALTKRVTEVREGLKNGTITKEAGQELAAQLIADSKKARLSIDKIKTPEVGRLARERIRKGSESFESLANVGKEQAAREQASADFASEIEAGVTVEKLDKLLRDQGHGAVVDKVIKAHNKLYDGEYGILAKQLQAVFDTLNKKK